MSFISGFVLATVLWCIAFRVLDWTDGKEP